MKLSGEWGEYFAPELSPFGYNETKAMEWFPMEKEAAISIGFCWSDYEAAPASGQINILRAQIPDDISKVQDDICSKAVICETSGKPFKVLKADLEFYRKKGLSIPRDAPQIRHQKRVRRQNKQSLFKRFCESCGTAIVTSSDPSKPYAVFCLECYEQKVA